MTVLFRTAAALTIASLFAQIVLGAVVRLTDSGLACPDWPLCYGLWIPTPEKLALLPEIDYSFAQVMLEWVHRFNAAALVAPLTLLLVVLSWRLRAMAPDLFATMAVAAILLLIQAGLGGLTVLDRNSPWSVAVHLTTALLLLALVLRAYLLAGARLRGFGGKRGGVVLAPAAALLALATVASGAMVAKSGASLACATWPLCDGAIVPDLTDSGVRLNFVHRLLAAATALAVAALWLMARQSGSRMTAGAGGAARIALWLVILQILIGAAVLEAFVRDGLWVQVVAGVVHQAVGVLLFGALAAVSWMAVPAGLAGRPAKRA